MKKKYKPLAVICILLVGLAASAGCNLTSDETNASDNKGGYVTSKENSSSDAENKSSSAVISSSVHTDSDSDSDKDTKSDSSSNPENKVAEIKSISFNSSELTMTVGKSKKLSVIIDPGNTENKNLSWTSSDEKIASVDSKGTVTAHSEGNCIITVKSLSNPSVKAEVHIKVQKKEEKATDSSSVSTEPEKNNTSREEPKHRVSGISLSFYEAVLNVGESIMPCVTISPDNAYDKTEIWTTSDREVAAVDEYGNIIAHSEGSCIITVASADNESVYAEIFITVIEPVKVEPPKPNIPENPDGETYINGILVVNKTYSLPSDYNPGGLTQECSTQFELLRQGAAADGINIYLSSGFRSYDYQSQLYNGYVGYYGQDTADTFSARPGHSEHQTGLAIDCNIINDSFIGTPEAVWLAEHCYVYGFIIRYPQGKEDITGYKYEPWHIRYVGTEVAEHLYNSGLTLEEYLGISSVYSY